MKNRKKTLLAAAALCAVLMLLLNVSAEGIIDKFIEWGKGKGLGQEKFYYYYVVAPLMRVFFIYLYTIPFIIVRYCDSFTNHFGEIILANPSFSAGSASYNPGMAGISSLCIKLGMPFYLLAIAGTAFYMLFATGSPHGRAKAKSLLKRLLVSIFFFSISPYIAEAMMMTSQSMASAILASADTGAVKEILRGGVWGSFWIISKIAMTDLELGIPFWLSLYIMAWMPYVIMSLRYILVTLFCMVFPIGIALYSFVFLRDLGRKILEQTLVWIYMQVFFALAIITIAAGVHFYDVLPDKPTPFSGVNWIPLPWANVIFQKIFEVLNIQILGTNIIAFSLGTASYALIFAVPFMIVRLLHHFLP